MIKKIIILFKLGRKVAKSDILNIISKFQKPPLLVKILFKRTILGELNLPSKYKYSCWLCLNNLALHLIGDMKSLQLLSFKSISLISAVATTQSDMYFANFGFRSGVGSIFLLLSVFDSGSPISWFSVNLYYNWTN